MKIYLAATAPTHEGTNKLKSLDIHHRLLSYYLISIKTLGCAVVFGAIVDKNRSMK
jgi:hypothetical protein